MQTAELTQISKPGELYLLEKLCNVIEESQVDYTSAAKRRNF